MASDSTAFNQLPNLLHVVDLREPRAVLGEAELTVSYNMCLVRLGKRLQKRSSLLRVIHSYLISDLRENRCYPK